MELQQQPLTTPETTPAAAEPTPEVTVDTNTAEKAPMSKQDIVAALKECAEKEAAEITREEVNRLKVQFYAIRNDELAAEKAESIARETKRPPSRRAPTNSKMNSKPHSG